MDLLSADVKHLHVDRKLRERLLNKKSMSTEDSDELDRFRRSIRNCDCRDLRRCNNVECGAHLHRDYNAAVNIHNKAVRILKDVDHEEDDEFAEYNAKCG